MRLGAFVIVAVLVFGVAFMVLWPSSPAAAVSNDAVAESQGKVHLIYTADGSPVSGGGVILTSLRPETFLGVRCLAGEGMDGWGWLSGRTIRVPLDKIVAVVEFTSAEAYRNSAAQYTPTAPGDLGDVPD